MGLNRKWKLSIAQATVMSLLSKGHGTVCFRGMGRGWRATNRAGQEWTVSRSTIRALVDHGLVEQVNNTGLGAHLRLKVAVRETSPGEFIQVE